MKLMSQLILLSAGVLVAGVAAATNDDGKSMAKRDARTQKVLDNSRLLQQPRTMDEATATQVRLANGSEGILVPTELWNELSAKPTPEGGHRIVERDGSGGSTVEASTHE